MGSNSPSSDSVGICVISAPGSAARRVRSLHGAGGCDVEEASGTEVPLCEVRRHLCCDFESPDPWLVSNKGSVTSTGGLCSAGVSGSLEASRDSYTSDSSGSVRSVDAGRAGLIRSWLKSGALAVTTLTALCFWSLESPARGSAETPVPHAPFLGQILCRQPSTSSPLSPPCSATDLSIVSLSTPTLRKSALRRLFS